MSMAKGDVEHETLCFSVDGEWIMGLARDMTREGFRGHERAARTLKESLEGIEWGDVYAILQGDSKLVGHSPRTPGGANTLGVEDDDATEYKKKLRWLYGGCFYSGGRAWQPYAQVTGFGARDFYGNAADLRRQIDAGSSAKARLSQERIAHYADNPKRDRAIVLKVTEGPGITQGVNVLFREVELPVWWKPHAPHDDPQSALTEHLLLGKHLEERSHSLWYPENIDQEKAVIDAEIEELLAEPGEMLSSDRDVVLSLGQARAHLIELQEDVDRYEELQGGVDSHEDEAQGENTWAVSAEETEARRERVYQTLLTMHRRKIHAQAGPDDGSADCEGWVTIDVTAEDCDKPLASAGANIAPPVPRSYRVPRAPFIRWSLRRTTAIHLAPAWETVAPSGMKMYCDDANHTDWMLGSVPPMDLDRDYREDSLNSAAYRVRFAVQEEICGFEAGVLSGSGRTEYLRVVHPEPDQVLDKKTIAVIPHAGPEYYIPAASSAATITEKGGQLSHLAVVGRDEPTPIKLVHVPDALTLYPERTLVYVDCGKGEVKVQDY
jgi:phosphohistidine swiveling domain-containing protein